MKAKNSQEGIALPNIKTCYNASTTRTDLYWHINRQRKGIEIPKIQSIT